MFSGRGGGAHATGGAEVGWGGGARAATGEAACVCVCVCVCVCGWQILYILKRSSFSQNDIYHASEVSEVVIFKCASVL